MDSNLPSEHRNHEGTFSATLGIIVPNAFAFFTPFELLKTRILIAPFIAIQGDWRLGSCFLLIITLIDLESESGILLPHSARVSNGAVLQPFY